MVSQRGPTRRKGRKVQAGAALLAVLAAACGGGAEPLEVVDYTAVPAGTAVLTGVVSYAGEVPELRTLRMEADAACRDFYSSPIKTQDLVLGDGNTLANVFLRVTEALNRPAPAEPAVIDQQGCLYTPRVSGVMVGQPFRVLNSDKIMHNVHSLSKANKRFNRAMPAELEHIQYTLTREELMLRLKCDVHPWMTAYVAVMTHPYFDITGADGRYTISGLRAGSYEVEAWHERLGTQRATVTVADAETSTSDFTFSR
jgi:plastocyanin